MKEERFSLRARANHLKAAAIFSTSAALSGMIGHCYDTEVKRADGIYHQYIVQDNRPAADKWADYGYRQEIGRNIILAVTAMNLGGTAYSLGAASAYSAVRRREDEQEASQPPQTTSED